MQLYIFLSSLLPIGLVSQPFKNSNSSTLAINVLQLASSRYTQYSIFFFLVSLIPFLPFCSMLKPMSILLLQSPQICFFILSFLSNNSFTCRKYVYTIVDILLLCTRNHHKYLRYDRPQDSRKIINAHIKDTSSKMLYKINIKIPPLIVLNQPKNAIPSFLLAPNLVVNLEYFLYFLFISIIFCIVLFYPIHIYIVA